MLSAALALHRAGRSASSTCLTLPVLLLATRACCSNLVVCTMFGGVAACCELACAQAGTETQQSIWLCEAKVFGSKTAFIVAVSVNFFVDSSQEHIRVA